MSLQYLYMLSHNLLHKPWPYKILVTNVVSKVALRAATLICKCDYCISIWHSVYKYIWQYCNIFFFRTESTVTLIFRIRIASSTSAGEIETDHNHLNNLYSRLQIIASNNSDMVEVLYVRSSKYCHEDKTYGNKILHWPVATIGQIVLPIELCVNWEGFPVQRHCSGDFVVGAFWSDENENNGTQYEVICKNSSYSLVMLNTLHCLTYAVLQFPCHYSDRYYLSHIFRITCNSWRLNPEPTEFWTSNSNLMLELYNKVRL